MPVELEPPDHCDIVGQVKGDPPAGASVEAVWRTLADGSLEEQVVADGVVSGVGWYRMRYRCPLDSGADRSLSVRLRGPGGELIAESAPVHSPPARVRIDLRPSRTRSGLSEYTALEQEIAETLESGVAGLDGAEEAVLDEVSEWLDVDAERLQLFQESRACEQELGLPGQAFYALGREGLDLSLDGLLDVPIHELRTTLTEAVADGIVDAAALGDIETLVEQLAEQVVDRATRDDREPEGAGLVDVLEAADIPRDTIAQVLQLLSGTNWRVVRVLGVVRRKRRGGGDRRRRGARCRGRDRAGRGARSRSGPAAARAWPSAGRTVADAGGSGGPLV